MYMYIYVHIYTHTCTYACARVNCENELFASKLVFTIILDLS